MNESSHIASDDTAICGGRTILGCFGQAARIAPFGTSFPRDNFYHFMPLGGLSFGSLFYSSSLGGSAVNGTDGYYHSGEGRALLRSIDWVDAEGSAYDTAEFDETGNSFIGEAQTNTVPEPGSFVLIATGIMVVAGARRWRIRALLADR